MLSAIAFIPLGNTGLYILSQINPDKAVLGVNTRWHWGLDSLVNIHVKVNCLAMGGISFGVCGNLRGIFGYFAI